MTTTRTTPRRAVFAVTAGLALALGGCSTMLQAASQEGPAAMGGTRALIRGWEKTWGTCIQGGGYCSPISSIVLTPLFIVDHPLSLVGDLLILPWAIFNEVSEDGIEPDWQVLPEFEDGEPRRSAPDALAIDGYGGPTEGPAGGPDPLAPE